MSVSLTEWPPISLDVSNARMRSSGRDDINNDSQESAKMGLEPLLQRQGMRRGLEGSLRFGACLGKEQAGEKRGR